MSAIEITYFSDVLCIWAYVAQARIDAVKKKFGDTVQIKHQFCYRVRAYGSEGSCDLG